VSGMDIALFLLLGVLLGCAYFSGLWYTVRRVGRVGNATRVLISSFLVRAVLLGVAFVWIARQGAWALGMAILGFLAARLLATSLLRPKGEKAK